MDIVDEILELFEARGAAAYLGEPVSQTEHALQTAHLAVQDGASDALVAAALLHDIGHLLGPEDDPAERGIDALHEQRGCSWLARHFGPEVTEPIRLHVLAKRYLCAVEALYRGLLSPKSIRSLELQGGALTRDQVQAFECNPHAGGAIRVRRWDDRAKVPNLDVPGLGHYVTKLRRLKAMAGPER
jgi:[1-hydroxy-2-(trimethylamino)ethyl]phosphonate dioxygenase